MCKPLQNKKLYKSETEYLGDDYHYFLYNDVKSAVEWLIQQHEEEIEYLIKKVESWTPTDIYIDIEGLANTYDWRMLFKEIQREYEAIMLIEEAFSDVI